MTHTTARRLRTLALCPVFAVVVACSGPVAAPTTPGSPPSSPPDSASPPSSPPSAASPTTDDPVIATELAAPWSVVFYRGVALVSERDSARIVELGAGHAVREVGQIPDAIPSGEGGLLGLAVHDSWLYAYYTAADGNRVERFEVRGDPGGFSLGPGETVIEGLPSARYHNGGRIAFGPDQSLYVTVGDAGDRDSAQNPGALSGKILRLTPDGGIPADNPFPGSPVYSYGHRNPQGLAWDAAGTMYATEFGQDTWDELNVIEPGHNYGWPVVEGIADREGFVDPVQQWRPSEASPSGLAFADNTLYIANLRGERLREVPLADLGTSTERFVGELGRLRDVAVTPDGELWVVTNNTDGRGEPRPG
ncbi:MAG: PQQ-dependent sugar dehydrogenase, partial [Propionicimonas sp.]|uniref:PQQ-dependent sugar dehydrogenase n=1 Tax=Propionicimonas sp. TaxID=1955623 RepID=UPI002B1F670F